MKADDILWHCLVARRRDDRSTGDHVLRLLPYCYFSLSCLLNLGWPVRSLGYLAACQHRTERLALPRHAVPPLTL